jgi:hypothetical protein
LIEFGCETRTFAEISFPPFGFVLSVESPVVDERLVGITHFAGFRYQDFAVAHLKFPALPVCSPYPGDFRSLEQIKANLTLDRDIHHLIAIYIKMLTKEFVIS